MKPNFLLLFSAIFLSACVTTPREPVSVRHFASTETAGDGARWHIFLFDPDEPRDLDARIALAKKEIAREPGCTWADRPRARIEAQTAAQGAQYEDRVLAAPLICEA
ncbi:hypothetical protein [Palleronia caenipelagi]|uniref:hypothetical protein n=1 Tax=Palleronia caenipelagi TaxID=2489174 RepID=UPI00115D891A|nr:hypothetical protein [Palleronia caenipelagi]